MRTLTDPAAAKLAQNCGTESVLIVEIQWVPNGGICAYADRKIASSVLGQIVELGSIDSSVKTDGSTDSSQVRLVLNDTDGAIKAICANHDLVKRPVWVYQWFDGLALSDKFLLFKGEINSPFTWDEGARTVAFDATTRIEEMEAGFSMEEGDFPLIPPDALGKVWPLAFGSVCDVKAVQVRSPRYGILQSGEGIHDYTLESRICQARYIQCVNVTTGMGATTGPVRRDCIDAYNRALGLLDQQPIIGMPLDQQAAAKAAAEQAYAECMGTWGPDQSCVENRWLLICNLIYQLQQQKAYEHGTMTIRGANTLFPQGQTITLNIEGGKFTGCFSGDIFTITGREHPDVAVLPSTKCVRVYDRSFMVTRMIGSGWRSTAGGTAWYDANLVNGSSGGTDIDPQSVEGYCDAQIQSQKGKKSVGGPVDSQRAYDAMATNSFFWARAGSKVFLEAEDEVLYIVNLLPCTITRVAAMKQTQFGSKLTTVPADRYTIYETNYNGYTVTEIGMTKPLSQWTDVITNPDGTKRKVDSKWSDDLYVTLTSSVGPNPVDIIQWLITKYTSLAVNSASFAHVKSRLTNYPAAFALTARKNVMELAADIAIQSRCVVCVRNDVVYLKYFSEEPTTLAATITASDVLANSLKVTLSSNEEMATKHTITWSRSQSEGELKVVLKHNVAKYGNRAKDHDYYTLNVYGNILKSATFWAIRDANIWKLVEFATPLKHLALEVFDCVTLDLAAVAPAPVKAVITAVKYDVANEQVTFTCWTPLKAGQTEPYIHAWPADIPAGTIFPTPEEREEGLGYDFIVAPPQGHLLYTSPVDDGQPKLLLTSGDPHPSDLDDVLESCFCPTTDDAVVDELDPVFEALTKAQTAANTATQGQMNAGAGGKNDKNKKPKKNQSTDPARPSQPSGPTGPEGGGCGALPCPQHGCLYTLRVVYCTPTQIHCLGCDCEKCGANHSCFCGVYEGVGDMCFGDFLTFTHTFSSMYSATQMATELEARRSLECQWEIGTSGVYTVDDVVTVPDDNPNIEFREVCESAPGSEDDPFQGETYEPELEE